MTCGQHLTSYIGSCRMVGASSSSMSTIVSTDNCSTFVVGICFFLVLFFFVYFFCFWLHARLSWSHSAFESMLNSSILSCYQLLKYSTKLSNRIMSIIATVLVKHVRCHFKNDVCGKMNVMKSLTNIYHRLRGSASPVLTATHHSYGSLAWLSEFFSGSPLEVRPPNRFWRKMAQTTYIHARMILLQ